MTKIIFNKNYIYTKIMILVIKERVKTIKGGEEVGGGVHVKKMQSHF